MRQPNALSPESFHPANPYNVGAARQSDYQHQPLPTGPPLKTALKIVSRSTETRASNAARAALVVANVTPTGYRVGKFMADHARYATEADIRRNVVPGEIFCYWPQAKIAAAMGCSERQVRRGVRSMREAGALEVRRRVRPCEASYVWVQPVRSDVRSGVRSDGAGVRSESACVLSDVRSGVLSGVRSHTEEGTEPQKNHEGSSRARVVCEICGHNWPASYGANCHKCRHDPSTETPADDKPPDEPKACTCGDAYSNSYGRQCVDCEGEPSLAQRAAVQAAQDAASTPPRAETEDEPPPKSDPDALLRWWKKERANFNRKHHIGETNGGHTDERTEASGEHDAARRPNDKPANPDGYRGTRIRNCPQCLSLERGFEDRCQSCDWTRAAWEARRST